MLAFGEKKSNYRADVATTIIEVHMRDDTISTGQAGRVKKIKFIFQKLIIDNSLHAERLIFWSKWNSNNNDSGLRFIITRRMITVAVINRE